MAAFFLYYTTHGYISILSENSTSGQLICGAHKDVQTELNKIRWEETNSSGEDVLINRFSFRRYVATFLHNKFSGRSLETDYVNPFNGNSDTGFGKYMLQPCPLRVFQ